ncbi:PAS domain-containing protein [Acidisoma cellulosilytica]|uniref:PAS domain-containing protein n=1 Tax=Acidisoma cellulosilyticum TaxID=2802395 RepID=A0A963Z263_9PROT|nr:CheR family methyltransferase [Acidisoma cellulosilyticum]MCB8881154.1 PAS domain-containing protein [Acidisoma cellulosilyticum]
MTKDPSKPTPVIVIGASAGGIQAFQGFFEHMPPDSGFALVVMLHLPSDRKSILPDIIGRWTAMPVIEAKDECRLEPNCVYVPPPGVVVIYRGGRLQLHRPETEELREFSPISLLLGSLAEGLKEDAVGVILSGTGSDGALGLKAIKEQGGLTLVQGTDGTGPQHDGMPLAAIATGAVDVIAPVEAMPGRIMAVQLARRKPDSIAALPPDQVDAARLEICAILQRSIGHDFSGYKDKTFLRRVQRRMQVLGLTSIQDFMERLKTDRQEVVMLFRDLLIGVTSFFRDEATFDFLKTTVIPLLFEGKGANDTIRIWIPGCATGEEAYSLAILMREHLDRIPDNAPKVLVFATDIDEPAIATARMGRYPDSLLLGMSPERLSRYFVHGIDGSYTIAKSVRELCTFSAHSLTRDPPFSRINLLSCRNLLIYLDLELQGVVIPAFHYSLVPNGILLLGSSETVNRHENLFTTLDRAHRVFQKRDVPSPALRMTGRDSLRIFPPQKDGGKASHVSSRSILSRLGTWASTRVMERFAPPFVIVTADAEALHFSPNLTRYLDFPSGVPSQNILVMARPGLRAPLRALLRQAIEIGRSVERSGIVVEAADGRTHIISLVVEPRREQGLEPFFLVVFIETAQARHDDTDPSGWVLSDLGSDRQLETELRDTREQLQSITEEHDTALEELRSANEELHSVNEELQSTNEELETSKEEIQSINEELQTVNNQLAGKVDELDHKNSDLKNLFESTQVATIFLDPYLVIRSFTPAIAGFYNLIPSDQGRPLTDIVSRLRYANLREDCRLVLQTLEPLERRIVRDDDATHYLMRILPYRTPDSRVDGTIVTFVDVTSVVQAEQHQRLLVDELNHRVKNMLTVVISIATQTIKRSDTLAEFERSYMGRVHALSAAYALLSEEGWQRISLEALLSEELQPFLSPNRSNILLDGENILLAPRAALSLGMAIHELTTNAVKHGALSLPEGLVRIAWAIEESEQGDYLVLTWIEQNGPTVIPPTRRGFGMTLIERGLRQDMSAEVSIEFLPTGVSAKLRAPMPLIEPPPQQGAS